MLMISLKLIGRHTCPPNLMFSVHRCCKPSGVMSLVERHSLYIVKVIKQFKKEKKKAKCKITTRTQAIKENMFPYRNGQHFWGWGLWEQLQEGEAPSGSDSESEIKNTSLVLKRDGRGLFSSQDDLS